MKQGILAPFAERLLAAAGWSDGAERDWVAGLSAALAVILLTLSVGWLLKNVVTGALRRLAARTASDLDDKILDLSERPMFRLIRTVGFYIAVRELPLSEELGTAATGVLLIILVWVTVRVATQIAVALLMAYAQRVGDEVSRQRFARDYVPLLTKVCGTLFVLLGLVAVLHHFHQDVSSVVAALGIGGLAISFAAKETLGNMFAGFTILVDRPFRPGDRIRLASGEVGDVVEVGTRSTRVRLVDQNMLIVPNAELVNTRVVNFNYPTHATRAQLDVTIAYGSDLERAKAIVLDAVKGQPEVTEPPAVLFTAFGDSGLLVSAFYVVPDFVSGGAVQDRVRTQVYREFTAAGIKIPYPTRELIVAPTAVAAVAGSGPTAPSGAPRG